MRVEAAILLALAVFGGGSALADQDNDAITNFGLTGHWAARCQEPPNSKNPHRFFVVSPIGNPLEQIAGGELAASGVLLLSNVHVLDPDKIAFTTTINGALYNVMITKRGNKHRTMDVISAAGQAATSHGIITATGAETPWLERCPY